MARSKKRQSTPQKPQGMCIFCQGHGMTKQHVWPNWISKSEIALQSQNAQRNTHSQALYGLKVELDVNNKLARINPYLKRLDHQGSILSRKLRMVCANCNNTWMSDLENKAKEIVLRLQAHQDCILSTEEQVALATWITLLTIVAEFTDIPQKKIPLIERALFYQEHKPLPDWQIWIGKYRGIEWDLRYRHYGIGGGFKRQDASDKVIESLVIGSAQSSTFVIGGLLIVVMSADVDVFKERIAGHNSNSLYKIWPLSNKEIEWNKALIHSDAETLAISDACYNDIRDMALDSVKNIK
jgi:hypothetical protein